MEISRPCLPQWETDLILCMCMYTLYTHKTLADVQYSITKHRLLKCKYEILVAYRTNNPYYKYKNFQLAGCPFYDDILEHYQTIMQ